MGRAARRGYRYIEKDSVALWRRNVELLLYGASFESPDEQFCEFI
jgi:hypothetical protein